MDYDYGLYDSDLIDGDSYYYGDGDDEENDIPALTLPQVYHMCLKPAVYDSMKTVSHVFIWCFVYSFMICNLNVHKKELAIQMPMATLANKDIHKRIQLSKLCFTSTSIIQHVIGIICGCLSLHSVFSTSVYYIITLVFISYSVLFISSFFQFKKNRGVFLIVISLSYMCICELWAVDSVRWHRIRGPQMLVTMKSVSLAFDLDIGTIKTIPNLIYYLGYILCPSSSVFGPWISFSDYMNCFTEKWSFKSVRKIFMNLILALLFLSISTCWSEYFISRGSLKWLAAYRDALSFRTSHYFICYLSEVTLLLSGRLVSPEKAVTKPHKVEFPRSVVNVVIYWNIPMHNWLKVYIFNTSKKFGNFFAILSTYTVSSLLHGINFQLSAVLLSLGIYSYIEVMLRKKLAVGFSACILAKECKPDCSHKHKKYHPFVLLTNAFLVFLTIFHLTYLGVVFEPASHEEEVGYSWKHSLNKWASLNFLSPYAVLLTYIMYFLIK